MSRTSPRKLAPFALLALLPVGLSTTCDGGGTEEQSASTDIGVPAPRARMRISGFMNGRLEPCGCAGGQLGGLPRRVFYLNRSNNQDLLIEGGNVVAGGSPLDSQKMLTALQILALPEYHVLGLGPADLRLPLEDLEMYLGIFPMTPICSDLVAPDAREEWPVQAYHEQTTGDATVRIASLTFVKPSAEGGDAFKVLPPKDAWKRAMAGVAPSTYRVVLVHGSPQDARAQAVLDPKPDLIVGFTELIAEPPSRPELVDDIPVVFPGTRGRMIVELTLTRIDGVPQIPRYHVESLKASETAKGALEDNDAKAALLQHRRDVKELGIREQMANLLPTANGAQYVGSKACQECHEEAYEVWENTKHAKAWQTLEEAERGERYGWPVTHYPDCVGCHVVGYGYQSGFVNPETTPQLRAVGCEQCHGPGSKHVADDSVVLGKVDKKTCLECHDFEQSPDFRAKYNERWKKIAHN